jgi:hypothetical protein
LAYTGGNGAKSERLQHRLGAVGATSSFDPQFSVGANKPGIFSN